MFSDMIQPVKKLLLIFLLVLLPLQFCWAAAAAYCQHDPEKTAQHVYRHTHQQDPSADIPDDGGSVIKAHAECGYCHLSCQAPSMTLVPEIALPSGPTHSELLPRTYSSHIPDSLYRPDWRLVA